MTNADLAGYYGLYLDCLNSRRFDDLVAFVHDELTYNGEPMTCQRYGEMIARNVAAMPGLRFDATLLVASDNRVACRLLFAGTPTAEFLGFPSTGRPVSFAEHVFYRFQDGRIAEVWSLIDRAAVAEQLGQ